jgi:GIY-YIG catalytic domain
VSLANLLKERRSQIEPEKRQWCIYRLIDPRDESVRYIGVTIDPFVRYSCHLNGDRRYISRWNWLRKLGQLGLKPRFDIIESGFGDRWVEREQHWIAHYRSEGARLFNLTSGGEGTTGAKWTPETRQRMSEAARKRPPWSAERRQAFGQRQLGKKWPAWFGKRVSEAHKGKVRGPLPEAVKQKLSDVLKGQKRTAETRSRMRAAQRRKSERLGAEAWVAFSQSRRGKHNSPESIATTKFKNRVKFSARQREALYLRDGAHLLYKEIGKILGYKEENIVGNVVRRARRERALISVHTGSLATREGVCL